ncbi:TonB-dependent receptor [Aliiglaciecola sp. 3_MG-2023]|uniref:TonB-dependent receptor n=1 Tax=Aliiglaciecola sp. 3_MG-2023 TaxID=3062644 RepID=UPI0026E43BFD|nr:TonB-dependent receptor [Aliiglaciecola sp. 3_MG-2023]MDO6692874.1 TonB-dependent receptor [Aliiglaciecola sp. 3_MG-2023]
MRYLNPVSAAVFVALTSSSFSALAQSNSDDDSIEEVVAIASPIRDSQKAAIDAKRNATNFVDVVAADTIGRFPDQNLADSLGRVPGLAIERDQGQARYINFRGAPFRYTTIAIDGIVIPGAENGRIPRFDSFPSVITSRIEANKAITAKMPGEAIAGFINIGTFNPFDVQGWSVAADVGAGTQQLGDGDIEKFSLRTSYSEDEWGFSLFGSKNSREQTTDNREYDLEYVDGLRQLNEIDFRSYKVKREDESLGGRIEYRPNGGMDRVYLSTLYTKFSDHEQRNQYVFDFAGGAGAIDAPTPTGDTGYLPVVLASRLLEEGVYENSTWTSTLGFDKQLSDWFIEAKYNRTETSNETFLPIPYSVGGAVAASYDLTDINDPKVSLFSAGTTDLISVQDISYAANLGLIVAGNLDIDSDLISIDAERSLNLLGQASVLNTGLSLNKREAQGNGMSNGITSFPVDEVDIVSFDTGELWDTDFTNSLNASYYDNPGLLQAWEAAAGALTPAASDDQVISIEEQINAVYAMLTTEKSWGNWVVGMRVEQTDYTSSGPNGSYSDDDIHVLPSALVNINLADDLKLRLSLNSAISRPTYGEWRASASIDYTSSPVQVSGGNPSLKAEEAWGGDIALEWYAADASLLSIGLFTRQIDNVIYADSSAIDGGVYADANAGETWQYTGFINGQDGKLSGLEINAIVQASDMQIDLLEGFGVSANATFLDSEFTTQSGTTFSLPGTSEAIYNASVFYENDAFSARLNYQYRDSWLSTTENDSMGEYWAAQTRVDISLSYALPWDVMGGELSIYANANNLTDELDVRYVGDLTTPNQVERYGKRYLVGVRFNY